jgi:hypothetical protein
MSGGAASEIGARAALGAGARLGPGVEVAPRAVVGPGARFGRGAIVDTVDPSRLPTPDIGALPAPADPGPSTSVRDLAPLAFEPNLGQADPRADHIVRGLDYQLFLGPDEVIIVAGGGRPPSAERYGARQPPDADGVDAPAVLRLTWEGARPDAPSVGEGRLPGVSNYLFGEDPSSWYTEIPRYSRVRYVDVYPGIDLVYYGTEGELEYDWVVKPGADPGTIAMAVEGAARLLIDDAGDLVMDTAAGEIAQRAPVFYQVIAGERRTVYGGYRLEAENRVRFAPDAYDRSLPLVIDPVLTFASYLGGGAPISFGIEQNRDQEGNDKGTGIAVDLLGNVYVTGYTRALDYPSIPGGFQSDPPHLNSQWMGFVTKLDPTGLPVYSTYIGKEIVPPDDPDEVFAYVLPEDIAVDELGAATIAGVTSDNRDLVNFSPVGFQAFVARLSPDGSAIELMKIFGGRLARDLGPGAGTVFIRDPWDEARALALDSDGNAWVVGATNTVDFPVTGKAVQPRNGHQDAQFVNSEFDAFVARLNPAGELTYASYLGGGLDDLAYDVALDKDGRVIVVGQTFSSDFPETLNALELGPSGLSDGFITVLSADGRSIHYSSYLGGIDHDWANAVVPGADGDIYVGGGTRSPDVLAGIVGDPDLAALQSEHGGPIEPIEGSDPTIDRWGLDGFVARITDVPAPPPGGLPADAQSRLRFFTYLGGAGQDEVVKMARDSAGNLFLTGFTSSPAFRTQDQIPAARGDAEDAIVVKLSAGGGLLYSTLLGGSATDIGLDIAVDPTGAAHVTGWTGSNDFPVANAFQESFGGGTPEFFSGYPPPRDAFVARLAGRASSSASVSRSGRSRQSARPSPSSPAPGWTPLPPISARSSTGATARRSRPVSPSPRAATSSSSSATTSTTSRAPTPSSSRSRTMSPFSTPTAG